MKVGVLLPKSNMYPTLGRNYINGIKLGLTQSGEDSVELEIRSIGLCTDGARVAQDFENQILMDDYCAAVGFIGQIAMTEISSVADANRIPLLVSNLGANPLAYECERSNYVFYNSMNARESAYLAAGYLASKGVKTIALAISFYDAGYHIHSGLIQGLNNHGIEVISNYVQPAEIQEDTESQLEELLINCGADAVVGIFSGLAARTFAELAAKVNLTKRVDFYTTQYAVHSSFLKQYKNELTGVKNFGSWSVFDETAKKFNHDFHKNYDEHADEFALLGYETGLFLAEAIKACGTEKVTAKLLAQKLREIRVLGPRGERAFSDDEQKTQSKHFLREVVERDGEVTNEILEELKGSKYPKDFYQVLEDVVLPGWKNPYFVA